MLVFMAALFTPSLPQADRFGHVIDMLGPKPTRPRTAPPNRLREWRLAAGLSQEELAEKVGTTGQSIGRYEAGKRSVTLEMLEQFAAVIAAGGLDCKPADLLADPDSALDDRERALLAGFKTLDEQDRVNVFDLVEALLARAELRALKDGAAPARPPRLARRYN